MSAENIKLEENKKTVVGFYQKALFEGDVDTAIRLYGGKTYTQHTPFAADGFDGLRNYATWIAKNYPHTRGEIKRVFADGDFVLLHCHYTGFLERTATPSSTFSGWRTARSSSTGMSFKPSENVIERKHDVLIKDMLGSLPDAEDAVQETLLRAWRYLDSVKESAP